MSVAEVIESILSVCPFVCEIHGKDVVVESFRGKMGPFGQYDSTVRYSKGFDAMFRPLDCQNKNVGNFLPILPYSLGYS